MRCRRGRRWRYNQRSSSDRKIEISASESFHHFCDRKLEISPKAAAQSLFALFALNLHSTYHLPSVTSTFSFRYIARTRTSIGTSGLSTTFSIFSSVEFYTNLGWGSCDRFVWVSAVDSGDQLGVDYTQGCAGESPLSHFIFVFSLASRRRMDQPPLSSSYGYFIFSCNDPRAASNWDLPCIF